MADELSRVISDFRNLSDASSQSTLANLQSFLDQALQDADDSDDQPCLLWEELATNGISLSSFVNPIALAMDSGTVSVSLLACKVYLSLILTSNSPALSLFTPMSFLSLLQAVRRALKKKKAVNSPSSDVQPRANGGQVNRKGKGRGRNRSKNARLSRMDCDDEGGEGENEFNVRVLFDVLDRLGLVLELVHLDRFPDSLKSLVQTTAEIPILGLEFFGASGNYRKLCGPCEQIFVQVLKPEHGEVAATAAEMLKSLSSLILLIRSPAKTFALGFVTNQMMDMVKCSEGVRKAMVNLPRYLSQKAPERAESRTAVVESIMEIVKAMQFEDQVEFINYVLKMCQGKAQLRLLAVDLIQMLVMSVKDPFGMTSDNGIESSWGLRCLEALIERCSDSVAGVRARAMSNLAHLIGSLSCNETSSGVLRKALGFGRDGSNRQENSLNELLKKRCLDEKASVRRASLLLITKLVDLSDGYYDIEIVMAMGMACSDALVSIRKAAISALSEAFRKCSDNNMISEWLHSVPRLISDSETSIQEECENLFLELVLNRVSKAGSSTFRDKSVRKLSNVSVETFQKEFALLYPEGLFDLLNEICNGEVTPWVKKICSSLGKKKKLKHAIVTSLQNVIKTSESLWLEHSMPIDKWTAPPGAWLILSEVSSFLPKAVDWEFLHHHWKLLDKDSLEQGKSNMEVEGFNEELKSNSVAWAGDRVLLLQTISNVSVELPPGPASELAYNLFKRLEEFKMHSTEVNAHSKALKTLCKRQAANSEEADNLVRKWSDQLLSKAFHIIEKFLSVEQEAKKDPNFLTPPCRSKAQKVNRTASSSEFLTQVVTAVYTVGSLVTMCPSVDLKDVIPVLHGIITSGRNEASSNKILGSTISIKLKAPSLYIQAWATMGKICLADGKLAKRYIPLFVQELEKSDCAALRNNIVVMMADFCVRYTALVDCYIANITRCLRDSCELVRRQTFILLSRLLQTDYVKWRGILFLRFLLSLVDESEKVQELAEFLFGTILKAKAPLLAYNSFVEAVYVLNDCHIHSGHSTSQKLRAENRLFSIRGNDQRSRSKRMRIYTCLLKQMAPEQLLATFAKISAEILAAASDGTLKIEDVTGQSVLQDAFDVLSCKEIRIQTNRGSGASDSADMEEEVGDAAVVRGKVITQEVKKSLIQNTIPIFIELKRLLESKNSPLIGSLMECLGVLLKDYKNEIDEILVADKQLQKELIYDLNKYETANAKSTAQEAGACSKKPHGDSKVASAMADLAATAKAKSVLREVNMGFASPPLSSISKPKLKSSMRATTSKASMVLESVRKRQNFSSDEEN
ncbi:hypothetical protein V2J09_014301 [Rumex salicifolius]